jgi:hypothetical protein
MAGWASRGPRGRAAGAAWEADEERSVLRRTEGETSGCILSDYNNLIHRESGEEMRAPAETLALGLWVRHRSGRRTSAWVSFSGATIPAREADAGRCPSKWNVSRHVADLR